MPDRLLESFDIFRNAAAIPVRTNLICTRTVPANLLQTPRRAQSCRLFAGSSQAQSIVQHFQEGILSPLQIRFERASANLLRELLHLLELSIRRRLCGQITVRPGCASRTSISSFLRRNISRPALIRLRVGNDFPPTVYFTPTAWVATGATSFLPPQR